MTWLGRRMPKWIGTRLRRIVGSPRPSSARIACHNERVPSSIPPPKSPLTGPIAGNRVTRPLGATPEQLVPKPHTTPTPHERSVPARRTAKQSLRTRSSAARLCRRSHRTILRSSTGRSAPERQKTPRSARGAAAGSRPATRAAARVASRIGRMWSSSPGTPSEAAPVAIRAAPSTLPSRRMSTASTLLPPPSTARTAALVMAPPPVHRP